MFVNCKELGKDSLVKIYNLFEDPIIGVNVYLISEIYDVYERALSFGLTITLDEQSFIVTKSSKGESSLNPIVYSRPVSGCKLKIHNNEDDLVGLIVGSDNSAYGDSWVKGFNIADLDDSINLSINWSNITDNVLLKYISDNLKIIINPIYYKHTRPEDESFAIEDITVNGYGLGPWGGSNLKGFGE